MRLLFVADGRSPIARNWIDFFLNSEHEVHLASTFPLTGGGDLAFTGKLASFTFIPTAFSQAKRAKTDRLLSSLSASGSPPLRRSLLWSGKLAGARTRIRQYLGPLTLPRSANRLRLFIDQVQPDLVHAMRIPFEGMLAALALGERSHLRLLTSIWGNDFTLHAPSTPIMAGLTRRALARTDGLHTDCHRDIRLAGQWGFPVSRPAIVLPGAGGIQTGLFYPRETPVEDRLIIQPRGFRAYIDNQGFFQALPAVLYAFPDARIICLGMAGEAQVQNWIEQLGLKQAVSLLPTIPRSEVAGWFRRARVVVSPATHDGTPNTLLEAMACGCLPVVYDLESLREWIEPGVNGLLVDVPDPAGLQGHPDSGLASAIIQALSDDDLYGRAGQMNPKIIVERAAYERVMPRAEEFYRALVEG